MNKEEKNNYAREWRKRNPERTKIIKDKWRKNNLKKEQDRHNRWKNNNPEKWKEVQKNKHIKERANNIAKSNAWKNDYKKKGNICQICKSKERLEFHHTNYERHLGITLCYRCHRDLHKSIERRKQTDK